MLLRDATAMRLSNCVQIRCSRTRNAALDSTLDALCYDPRMVHIA